MEDPASALTGKVVPVPPELGAPEPEADATQAASRPVWRFLIEPRWLAWHLFAVVAVWGMLWLGDWQFHRALGGNGLSWAYTFEWPLFAGFGIVFWARTIRDEFRVQRGVDLVVYDRAVLPDGVGAQQNDTLLEDDAEDEELASYNAYLAKLNTETKAITVGKRAITNG
ncbi:MAG: hypothetical protein ACRDNW_05930 [Trebonia sp.]